MENWGGGLLESLKRGRKGWGVQWRGSDGRHDSWWMR